MKNILFIILTCVGLYSCKAQIYPMEGGRSGLIKDGMSFKDTNNNLNKFVGTWEYEDATIKLTVMLQKIDDYYDNGYYSDVIVGNIIYEENGLEIINTLTNPAVSQGSDDIYHIKMFSIKSPSIIAGFFEDPIRSKWTTYSLYLTYNLSSVGGNSQPQLEWSIRIRDFYNPNDDIDAEQESRVPRLLTLTKV